MRVCTNSHTGNKIDASTHRGAGRQNYAAAILLSVCINHDDDGDNDDYNDYDDDNDNDNDDDNDDDDDDDVFSIIIMMKMMGFSGFPFAFKSSFRFDNVNQQVVYRASLCVCNADIDKIFPIMSSRNRDNNDNRCRGLTHSQHKLWDCNAVTNA
uniref:Uncharacterized protein n=1 Tax=Glossina palpalis gambiensis TaxID=67801 RepID=A0A1B0BTU6_9MUSC